MVFSPLIFFLCWISRARSPTTHKGDHWSVCGCTFTDATTDLFMHIYKAGAACVWNEARPLIRQALMINSPAEPVNATTTTTTNYLKHRRCTRRANSKIFAYLFFYILHPWGQLTWNMMTPIFLLVFQGGSYSCCSSHSNGADSLTIMWTCKRDACFCICKCMESWTSRTDNSHTTTLKDKYQDVDNTTTIELVQLRRRRRRKRWRKIKKGNKMSSRVKQSVCKEMMMMMMTKGYLQVSVSLTHFNPSPYNLLW